MTKNTNAKIKIQNINAIGLIFIGCGAGDNPFLIVNAPLSLNLLLTVFEQLFSIEISLLGKEHIQSLLILLFSYFHLFCFLGEEWL